MIPFKSGRLSEAVDPIKIYEYFYFGLPVIVTGIKHLEQYPNVRVVSNPGMFMEAARLLQASRKTSVHSFSQRMVGKVCPAGWHPDWRCSCQPGGRDPERSSLGRTFFNTTGKIGKPGMDILVLYQFCSFGGVERVLLNRALAFESVQSDFVLHVGYLQDAGALGSFKEYIRNHHLEKRIHPFILPEREPLDYSRYEMILNIDTPQVLQKTSHCKNVFVECHTHYKNNRSYLGNLPNNITTVIVPSRSFAALLQAEFPALKDIFILPNPIPEAFHHRTGSSLVFGKRPLTYLARLDEQKNYPDVLRIFSSIQERKDVFQLIIGRSEDPVRSMAELEKNHLVGNTFIREHLSFDKIPALINLVRQHRGVFISPSNGESFRPQCRGIHL